MPIQNDSRYFKFLNKFNSQKVTLYRDTITYLSDDSETITQTKIADIIASVQPLSDSDMQSIPEGDREIIIKKIYTRYDIKKDDIIKNDEGDFKVKRPPFRHIFLGQLHHCKAIAYKIEKN